MKAHKLVAVLSFMIATLLLVVSVLRLGYKEDIADFLPVDSNHHNALKVYQDISEQIRFLLFSSIGIPLKPIPTLWWVV